MTDPAPESAVLGHGPGPAPRRHPARRPRLSPFCGPRPVVLALVLLGALAGACDKPSHENVDKWRQTTQGPDKLVKALKNSSLEADLRAHAAQALISLDQLADVQRALDAEPEKERLEVLAKLAPRLWTDAKIAEELQVPTAKQVVAKDALFLLRPLAGKETKDQIDGYLTDWLSGYYEGRSGLGLQKGEVIVRTLGDRIAPKLVSTTGKLLAEATATKAPEIGDPLLRGLAYSGSADSVGTLLDVMEQKDHPDETLGTRAAGFLFEAYVSGTEIQRLDPDPLGPHVERLGKLAGDEGIKGDVADIAFHLLAAAGPPDCLDPLARLARHEQEVRRWQAVQMGLKCGGTTAVASMAESLPPDAEYPVGIVEKYFWNKIVELGPGAVAPARQLLGARSWVARATGVAVLGRLGGKADAATVRKLAGDRAKMKGFYQELKKRDPTLGAFATETAKKLENR